MIILFTLYADNVPIMSGDFMFIRNRSGRFVPTAIAGKNTPHDVYNVIFDVGYRIHTFS